MRIRVPSLASLNGLMTSTTVSCSVGWRCCLDPAMLWAVAQAGSCRSNLTPSLRTSICLGSSLKKTKRKKKYWLGDSCILEVILFSPDTKAWICGHAHIPGIRNSILKKIYPQIIPEPVLQRCMQKNQKVHYRIVRNGRKKKCMQLPRYRSNLNIH